MAQISRAVAAGFPHHVTQRGNYQQRFSKDISRKIDEGDSYGPHGRLYTNILLIAVRQEETER